MNRLSWLVFVLLSCAVHAAEVPPRDTLGRTVKLKILVDKVLQPMAKWTTEEWMIRETAAAGFNVYSPRRGFDDLAAVERVTAWCRQYGIYHLVWMRGDQIAPAGDAAKGHRMVWAGGNEQDLWSPNSDGFWDWFNGYVLQYAKLSATMPNLLGVFLDYENYSPNGSGNLYDLSYDDDILKRFAAARGLTLPDLPFKERKPWLEQQGLHEAFRTFQLDHWRQRCRTLREQVDRLNPKFQFCLYPAPGTLFMTEATYPEWSTKQAPMILADPWVYGRPSQFQPQDEALQRNREILQKGMAVPTQAGIPFLYAGGIDPVVKGADPEFSGKNAVMISELTDGYWIFYEGPTYTKDDHKQYWKWFTWANGEIDARRWASWHASRETPEDYSLRVFGDESGKLHLLPPPVTGRPVTYPTTPLRGENLLLVAAKANQPVEVVLRSLPFAKYTSPLAWELRGPKLSRISSGLIPFNQPTPVKFTPPDDGVYLLGVSAGSNAYAVERATAPVGVLARKELGLVMASQKLYFQVPAGLKEFTLTITCQQNEPARLNVYDPTGKLAATGQTTGAERTAKVKVPVGDQAGKTWSLQFVKADAGTLEDHALSLDPKLPPVVSFAPEEAFGVAP